MNRLKIGILFILCLSLNSCKTLKASAQNIDGDAYQDELYYEYDFDYDYYDDFDRG